MNPKGEKLETCGLEDIKGSSTEPPEVDKELDTWLRVLNLTSWGTKSQLQHYDSFLTHTLIALVEHNLSNLSI